MTIPSGGMPAPIDDELLSAYLDGQISPAERDTVDVAITADPTVRARAADLRATVALLHGLPQPAPRRTFILTPEQAAAIRPVRVPWITRLFPTVAAVSAVAAVLCLMLVAGDLATGGFSTKQPAAVRTRPAVESVSDATTTRVTAAAAATTAAVTSGGIAASGASSATTALPAPAAAAALPAATVAAGSVASARSTGAPPPGAAIIIPSAVAPAATPTIVANVQPPPPTVSAAPSGGATVAKETHRVPVALVRVGEIVLALLAIAGIALVMLGRRGKMRSR
ncbi:MAG: hypothetical protein M3Z19_02405 [Chloroflexota bacterium]|nr:hypothetical protein [Chloroflexota bacterium]